MGFDIWYSKKSDDGTEIEEYYRVPYNDYSIKGWLYDNFKVWFLDVFGIKEDDTKSKDVSWDPQKSLKTIEEVLEKARGMKTSILTIHFLVQEEKLEEKEPQFYTMEQIRSRLIPARPNQQYAGFVKMIQYAFFKSGKLTVFSYQILVEDELHKSYIKELEAFRDFCKKAVDNGIVSFNWSG